MAGTAWQCGLASLSNDLTPANQCLVRRADELDHPPPLKFHCMFKSYNDESFGLSVLVAERGAKRRAVAPPSLPPAPPEIAIDAAQQDSI